MKIKLIDGCFKHIGQPHSLQGYDAPKHIEWCRDGLYKDISVYTDHFLPTGHLDNNDSRIQISWLIEPSTINTRGYAAVEVNHAHYDYIISHDRAFLSKFPKAKRVFCPASGSSLYSREWQIYPKSKKILTVVGNKKTAVGHRMRYEVVEKLGHKMDVVGRGFKPFTPDKKAETFTPYMYQVCIHNTPVGDYWSDILLDCIATGTVPIVWGSRYLKKYFNPAGIIHFDTVEQLGNILGDLCEEDYNYRAGAIQENFDTAFKKYKVVEDYLYDNFFKQFGS